VSSVKKAISDADFVMDCLNADLVVPAGGVSADFVRRESEFACGHLLTLGKTLSSSSKLVVVTHGATDLSDKEEVNLVCNLLPLPLRGRCPWNALKCGTA
jgi:hypothetical protein